LKILGIKISVLMPCLAKLDLFIDFLKNPRIFQKVNRYSPSWHFVNL